MSKAKILFLDVETSPCKAYAWGLWDQNIGLEQIIQDSYMLSWSAKWQGETKVMSDGLINYKSVYKKDPTDEHCLAKSIWKLMDEADIVVGHNGDNFDIKWLNTVFLRNGLQPPSSYKSVDTLKESRGNFYQLSHRLNFLCQRLSIGHKLKHEGFELWKKCMDGDVKAWKRMIHYNAKDVVLLEELYDLIKPFMKNHPNLALYTESEDTTCPTCQGTSFRKKGYAYTQNNKYQRWVCNNCGKNVREKKGLLNGKAKNIKNPRG